MCNLDFRLVPGGGQARFCVGLVLAWVVGYGRLTYKKQKQITFSFVSSSNLSYNKAKFQEKS